jgi:hypothetical protein
VKREKTGGRKPGSKNKINRAADLRKAAEAGGMLPLDYMLKVMRDETAPDLRRDDMAKSAAPYLHAKRAPEDQHGQTGPIGVWRIDAYEPKKRND